MPRSLIDLYTGGCILSGLGGFGEAVGVDQFVVCGVIFCEDESVSVSTRERRFYLIFSGSYSIRCQFLLRWCFLIMSEKTPAYLASLGWLKSSAKRSTKKEDKNRELVSHLYCAAAVMTWKNCSLLI